MSPDSPEAAHRPPHPLALELIERLRDRPGAPILEIGYEGSRNDRNMRALLTAGLVVGVTPKRAAFAAALSTHTLLHGTAASLEHDLAIIAGALEDGAPFYATFGSTRDARYQRGTFIEPHVYAPEDGDERGVAHAYFDQVRLFDLLAPHFTVESMREVGVDDIAGKWAHQTAPLSGAIHWFVVATKRAQ
jgi:hypothetical protein